VPVPLDVVVDVDTGGLPLAVDEGLRGQRVEGGLVQALEEPAATGASTFALSRAFAGRTGTITVPSAGRRSPARAGRGARRSAVQPPLQGVVGQGLHLDPVEPSGLGAQDPSS
jgi:hypothetical protein